MWPKTTLLLPVWLRDTKRLDTPASLNGSSFPCCVMNRSAYKTLPGSGVGGWGVGAGEEGDREGNVKGSEETVHTTHISSGGRKVIPH